MRQLLFCAVLAAVPALGWNHVGHKAVAGMAYDLLTPEARAKADRLIRNHPDYPSWLKDAPADEHARARYAFMQAAYWPDTIKGDARFYDDTRSDAQPTPTLPGYPDMKRHTNWHYINLAFSPDGTAFPPPPPVNALAQINTLLAGIDTDPSYRLPWVLHLIGDVHNPMHCTSRWKKDQVDPKTGKPWSDLGGNGVYVVGAYNLHAYWDDALGITDTLDYLNGLIRFMSTRGQEGAAVLDPEAWVKEGAQLAETVCYGKLGSKGSGAKEDPITLPEDYGVAAKALARERAALGARRLAAVLNERLK